MSYKCYWFASMLGLATFAGFCVGDEVILQRLIDEQRFDEAAKVASQQTDPDPLLGRIALAQLTSGSLDDSKSTMRSIQDPGALTSVAKQAKHALGGGTGADFDTLINLITNTVAPNSWDDVGGPGAIEAFPGGVFVDAKGVLRQSKVIKEKESFELEVAKRRAQRDLAKTDPRRPSELRMVSLTRLERELKLRAAFDESPSEAMKHLAGLQSIRYLFLFPESNECVIAGPAGDWNENQQGVAIGNHAPTLLLDDLVTLLRNARDNGSRFSCNISPKKSGLAATREFLARPRRPLKPRQTPRWVEEIRQTLGMQDIDVKGVHSGSHVAHVLVEADYHMKLIGMGLEPGVAGVESYLDLIPSNEIPKTMDVLRWWFTLRKNAIESNREGTAFVFAEDCVRLQTENERVTKSGDRVHTGRSSELNAEFAHRFTEHYDRLADEYPIYGQLRSLFQLALVAAVLEDPKTKSTLEWDTDWLVSSVTTAERNEATEVPSIVNHRVINRRDVVVGVSGGVVVDAKGTLAQRNRVRDLTTMKSDHMTAQPRISRSSSRWWWD